jgi:acyl-CoA synthetase (AMP-forming)/AMP-acid ligase II
VTLSLILEMAESGFGDRAAISVADETLTVQDLARLSRAAGRLFVDQEAAAVVYLGTNHLSFPVALFGAAWAGVPFIPINYRLGPSQMRELLGRHPGAFVLYDRECPETPKQSTTMQRETFLAELPRLTAPSDESASSDPDAVATLLYTSGTTSAPKAVVLRHRHLMAYLMGSVEFGGASPEDAALVAVPPYHVAGLANLLSNLYAGRRIIYLTAFDPAEWLRAVREERVTQAMVVPTMLVAIVDHLIAAGPADVPSLRSISYGGARMPLRSLERALELLPDVDFVNAYGLTETSSTIALLGPDDHRAAFGGDAVARARLGSVGRLLPGLELEVRDESGAVLGPDESGLLFVRGEQISGEYVGEQSRDPMAWFATRDRGHIDADGYLFIEGRSDDTIIRGGENIAPDEIEDVLIAHPSVTDAAVVGLPDERWGQTIAAVVVLEPGQDVKAEDLRDWCRAHLRSSKTPEVVEFTDALVRTETGKLQRRLVLEGLLNR